jgi:hypothetical protein
MSKDRVYRLKNGKSPVMLILCSRHTRRKPLLFFDGKSRRELRYAPNQKSPFVDEQDEHAVVEPVIFRDGMLRVEQENIILQDFLDKHPDNGIVFEEVDNEKDAQKEVEVLDLEFEALSLAKELDIDKLESIGRIILGVNVDSMSTAELKRDVRIYAKNNPEDFLSSADSSDISVKNNIAKMLEEKYLSLRNEKKEVFFNLKNNKKRLIVVPFGQTPIEALHSFFKSDEGVPIYEELVEKLD